MKCEYCTVGRILTGPRNPHQGDVPGVSTRSLRSDSYLGPLPSGISGTTEYCPQDETGAYKGRDDIDTGSSPGCQHLHYYWPPSLFINRVQPDISCDSRAPSMSPAQPAFVLAGGSWHIPAHYQAFHDVVSARGLKIIVPPLPSGVEGRVDAPFEADTKAVADAVRGLVEQGSDVVVIGHSSGGISAAEAAHGLGVRERAAKGLPGGVRSLVLVSGLGEPAGTQPQWDEESLASKAADTMAFEVRTARSRCPTRGLQQ